MNRTARSLLALGAVVLALLLHVGLVLRSYPLSAWAADEAPLRGDVDRYYANAWGAARAGGLYGYDLSCMAGYPVGLWNSMGKKGFEIAHLLVPRLSLPHLFYLVLVGVTLLGPLFVYLAGHRACATAMRRGALLALALIFWHLDAYISYFWGFGNVFFPGTVALVMVMVPVAVRTVDARAGWAWGLLLGLLSAAVFYFHTVLVITAAAPLLTVLVARRAALRHPRTWIALALAAGVALALCLPWLMPLWQTRGDCVPEPHRWFPGGPRNLAMDLLSDRIYQRAFDRNFLLQFAVLAGLHGLWVTRRQPGLLVVRALGAGAAVTLSIAYVFPLLSLGCSLQPYRFIIPSMLFLLPAAALSVASAADVVRRLPRDAQAVVALLLLLVLPRLTAYGLDLLRAPGAVGVTDAQRAVVDVLRREPVIARVLCEDAGLGHALPVMTGWPVIGGLSSQAFLKHRFAGVDEGNAMFGRGPAAWTPADLARYLHTYAVSHAVFYSPAWIAFARNAPDVFTPIGTVGGCPLYRVGGAPPSYVEQGEAEVLMQPRAIMVRANRGRTLVLRTHFDPMLRADVGVSLEPAPMLDDPVPFLRCVIPDGVASFTIRWSPRAGGTMP
ncbi:MAG: hypothetical protein K8T26_03000 [Lentisphaerae bacterium]|nr:hypothetical protein [Lentisphaerota bacterium]